MSPPKIPVEKVDADYLRRNLFHNPHTGELWWKIIYGRRKENRPAGNPDRAGYLLVRIFSRTYKTHRSLLANFLASSQNLNRKRN